MTKCPADEAPAIRHAEAVRRRELVFKAFRAEGLAGEAPTAPGCAALAAAACGAMGLRGGLPLKAAADTLMHRLSGRRLCARTLYAAAAALAGNREAIAAGDALAEWDGRADAWTALEVVDVVKAGPGRREVAMLSATGPPAGNVFRPVLTDRYAQFLLREIGYPKFKPCSARELFGLWLTCRVRMDGTRPRLSSVCASQAQRKRTAQLRAIRHGGCPFNKPTECVDCFRGLDACPGAVRPVSLERKECSTCGRQLWLEPGAVEECYKCAERHGRHDTIQTEGPAERAYVHAVGGCDADAAEGHLGVAAGAGGPGGDPAGPDEAGREAGGLHPVGQGPEGLVGG